MSMEPTWNQGAEPPPPKKSGSKAWLIIGVVLGVCVLLCCGGIVGVSTYFGSQVANMMSSDPVKVRESQTKIVEMEVPAELPPRYRFDLTMVGQQIMTLTCFGNVGDDNFVWFVAAGQAMQQESQGNPDKLRNDLEAQVPAQSQAAQVGAFKSLTNTTQRDVEVNVAGKASTLTLTEGESGGKKWVQVNGMFEGKMGPTLIKLQLEADKFPPEKVEEMLKSMK